jgi:hypothetical protein
VENKVPSATAAPAPRNATVMRPSMLRSVASVLSSSLVGAVAVLLDGGVRADSIQSLDGAQAL